MKNKIINLRRNNMRVLVILIIIFINFNFLYADFDYGFDFSKAGSAGSQFLKIGVGAREIGMGEAVSAVTNDINSIFWNPAGIGYVNEMQVSAIHNEWLCESQHDAVALAFPFKSYAIGLSFVNFKIKEFEETTVTMPEGTGNIINAGDILVGLALARKFSDKLNIGLQLKYLQENLADSVFSNVLFDIGTVYYTGFHNVRLAFTFQHFGPDIKLGDQKFRMPLLFRIGVAEDIIKNENMIWTVAFDLVHPTDNSEYVNLGTEYTIWNSFSLRAGYRTNVDYGELSIGGGINILIFKKANLVIDYAYIPFDNVFENNSRFGLKFTF